MRKNPAHIDIIQISNGRFLRNGHKYLITDFKGCPTQATLEYKPGAQSPFVFETKTNSWSLFTTKVVGLAVIGIVLDGSDLGKTFVLDNWYNVVFSQYNRPTNGGNGGTYTFNFGPNKYVLTLEDVYRKVQ